MINEDTIKLLKECNSGIKMGISSLDEVLGRIEDENLKKILSDCKKEHENLEDETYEILNEYHDSGKEPDAMAKGMSWLKTNCKFNYRWLQYGYKVIK